MPDIWIKQVNKVTLSRKFYTVQNITRPSGIKFM